LASQPETFLFEAHPIRHPAKARQSIGVSVMTYAGKKTAFVFTGGGSLGAIQVGMLCVLLGAGVWPDFVVGASVGALNASYFAGAPDIDCVTRLEVIWHGLKRSDIFLFSLATAVGLIRHPDYLVDPGGLRGVIEANLPFVRLEDAQIPLSIIATNLQGQVVRLSKSPALEAILASTAIPAVFPSVEIDGEPLMDGSSPPTRRCGLRQSSAPNGSSCFRQVTPVH
jgi:NTE family protein